jgi:hypothetical protein
MFVLRAETVTIFEPKMDKICKLCKAIFFMLYNISQPNFANLLISLCSDFVLLVTSERIILFIMLQAWW